MQIHVSFKESYGGALEPHRRGRGHGTEGLRPVMGAQVKESCLTPATGGDASSTAMSSTASKSGGMVLVTADLEPMASTTFEEVDFSCF